TTLGAFCLLLPCQPLLAPRKLDELVEDMPEIMVVIDSFEQKVQRPQAETERDDWYSRKKKTHTIKSQVAVDEATVEIVDIPDNVPGPTADIKLLEESKLLKKLPKGVGGMGDSGYQGIAKLHKRGFSPRKKPRGKDRPPDCC
ncbi:MAG: transposase family protein, partial [Chloroflexota bacterium]